MYVVQSKPTASPHLPLNKPRCYCGGIRSAFGIKLFQLTHYLHSLIPTQICKKKKRDTRRRPVACFTLCLWRVTSSPTGNEIGPLYRFLRVLHGRGRAVPMYNHTDAGCFNGTWDNDSNLSAVSFVAVPTTAYAYLNQGWCSVLVAAIEVTCS